MQRGEEFRRFWDEVCREDEGVRGEGKRGKDVGGELGRNARERLKVVGLDGRCESLVFVCWFVGTQAGKGGEGGG